MKSLNDTLKEMCGTWQQIPVSHRHDLFSIFTILLRQFFPYDFNKPTI